MQALKELVYIIQRNRLRSIELIGDGSENKTKVGEFFEAIAANQFESDEDAATYFYEDSNKNSPAYQKLKNSLLKRLLNTVFFIDVNQPSYNERQKAYYECYKDWAAAKILLGKNARISGIRLTQKILKQAKKYEFTDLTLDLTRTLRLHYGTQEGDLKRYEQYYELYRECVRAWEVENKAEELYTDLVLRYVNNKGADREAHEKAQEYYDLLKEDLETKDTYLLHLCGRMIQMMIHTTVNDYPATIQVCDDMIEFFEAKDYTASVPLQIAYYQQLVCYTQLKQYHEGRRVAQKCVQLLEEGSFNWFKYQELYFMLSMHTAEYQDGYKVFNQTVGHKRFEFLPPTIQETWKIFEAYLYYLSEIGQVKPAKNDKQFSKFRLGKFLNETPIFSKDKRGMNIPILVVQILFMILQKKYDEAIDRIEAIEKYSTRYLRRDDTFRSNCFIKMLLQIPKSGFHKAGVQRKTTDLLEKLHSYSLDIANQTHEIEILPYEELWKLVLDSLDYSFH